MRYCCDMGTRDTQDARVNLLDVELDGDGSGGSGSTRDRSQDWADAVVRPFRNLERAGLKRGTYARLEWSTGPTPPPWVDLITELPTGDLLRVRLRRRDDGDPIVEGHEVRHRADDPTFGARAMRRAGYGAVLDLVDRTLGDWAVATHFLGKEWRRQTTRPGRRGRPDLFYAEWASRYVTALAAGPNPLAALVDLDHGYTEGAIRGYLHEARNRLLLTAAPPGKAGGELTKKGRATLRAAGVDLTGGN
jgi:hypothetical protein